MTCICSSFRVRSSIAERHTDDVPLSEAPTRAGYNSPLWTMDSLTFARCRLRMNLLMLLRKCCGEQFFHRGEVDRSFIPCIVGEFKCSVIRSLVCSNLIWDCVLAGKYIDGALTLPAETDGQAFSLDLEADSRTFLHPARRRIAGTRQTPSSESQFRIQALGAALENYG